MPNHCKRAGTVGPSVGRITVADSSSRWSSVTVACSTLHSLLVLSVVPAARQGEPGRRCSCHRCCCLDRCPSERCRHQERGVRLKPHSQDLPQGQRQAVNSLEGDEGDVLVMYEAAAAEKAACTLETAAAAVTAAADHCRKQQLLLVPGTFACLEIRAFKNVQEHCSRAGSIVGCVTCHIGHGITSPKPSTIICRQLHSSHAYPESTALYCDMACSLHWNIAIKHSTAHIMSFGAHCQGFGMQPKRDHHIARGQLQMNVSHLHCSASRHCANDLQCSSHRVNSSTTVVKSDKLQPHQIIW